MLIASCSYAAFYLIRFFSTYPRNASICGTILATTATSGHSSALKSKKLFFRAALNS